LKKTETMTIFLKKNIYNKRFNLIEIKNVMVYNNYNLPPLKHIFFLLGFSTLNKPENTKKCYILKLNF